MSTFSPLRLNDDVRDETFSCGSLVSRLRISSEMPSLKYSFSASPLMLTNGSTAMVRRFSNGADVVGVACTSGAAAGAGTGAAGVSGAAAIARGSGTAAGDSSLAQPPGHRARQKAVTGKSE